MARGRSSGAAAAVVVVVGLVLLSRKSSAKGGAKLNLTGKQVERVHSWVGSVKDWASTRYGAALDAVKAHWGGAVDDAQAKDVALSLLTHWAIETANGAGEFNWNVGNINAFGDQQYFLVKDIDGTVHAERAYDSLTDGINSYVQLLASPRYAPAAKKLADDPTSSDWFVTLGKCGWFDPTAAKPPSSWDDAAKGFASRRKTLSGQVSQ